MLLEEILRKKLEEKLPRNRKATDSEFIEALNIKLSRKELKRVKKEFYGPFTRMIRVKTVDWL